MNFKKQHRAVLARCCYLCYKGCGDGLPQSSAVGIVASGDQFICNKEQKENIVKNTGALCTEMEGAAISHAAYRNNVPVVVIRAISDKADDSAQMDYPTFEAIAAKRCADVVRTMAKALTNIK